MASGEAPRAELFRALATLAEPPDRAHAAVAAALGLEGLPDSTAYTEIFLFQLYPYASVHLGPEGMMGGEARERVAGFWRAVGRTPPAEPDHLAALMALLASLMDEERDATDEREAQLVATARRALLHEHLAPWALTFLERVAELADGFYGEWADLTRHALEREVEQAGPPDRLPLHLREAPPLPDPRSEARAPFVEALLAPVRSGMMLTRADLTRLARTLGLGLRAGERRYILEQLLGQDPPGVLEALAGEAAARATRLERGRALLGVTADFQVDRARRTEALLRALAAEGAEALEAARTGTPPARS